MTKQKRADDIVNELQGSCRDLYDHVTPAEAQDTELLALVDAEIFCCNECGWWCETGEKVESDGDEVCQDCAGDA